MEKLICVIPSFRCSEPTRKGLDELSGKHRRGLTEFIRMKLDDLVVEYGRTKDPNVKLK